MKTTYHERWFRRDGRPVGEIEVAAARRRYNSHRPFCLVLWDGEVPVGFIESGVAGLNVGFLDDRRRVRLEYSFIRDGTRLFLAEADYNEFPDREERVARRRTLYNFRSSGELIVVETTRDSPEAKRSTGQVDVTGNWEPVPSFACLADLFVEER